MPVDAVPRWTVGPGVAVVAVVVEDVSPWLCDGISLVMRVCASSPPGSGTRSASCRKPGVWIGKLVSGVLPVANLAVPDPAASALKRRLLGYRQKNQAACAIGTNRKRRGLRRLSDN